MRIASLIPSATEILCALGLEDQLVGVTHECDYPESVLRKPKLTRSSTDHSQSSPSEIDRHIRESLHQGSSIYRLDRDLLERLDPGLVITQELCEVCAVSYKEVERAVKELYGERRVISLDPANLQEVLGNVLTVGRATGQEARARELVAALQGRTDRVTSVTKNVAVRPSVYCMEWFDPPYSAGHWVPGMVEMAGGTEALGVAGERSRVVAWEEIMETQPDYVILMPCGYNLHQAIERARQAPFPPEWQELPAVKNGRVYAVNGSAYYNRPGPRLVDGLEIMAQVLHPELLVCKIGEDQAARVDL